MWWLVRRPGFDVTKWKAKCRCTLCVCQQCVYVLTHCRAASDASTPTLHIQPTMPAVAATKGVDVASSPLTLPVSSVTSTGRM